MSNRINYTAACPKCRLDGLDATLDFDLDLGKIVCTSSPAHEYDSMPGEEVPKQPEVESASSNGLEGVPAGVTADGAAPDPLPIPEDEEARLSAIVSEMKGEEPASYAPAAPESEAEPITANTDNQPMTYSGEAKGQPVMDENGMARLSNGDAIFTVRVPEQWVSALLALGEEQKKPASEVLQEFMDQGLLEWFQNLPNPV